MRDIHVSPVDMGSGDWGVRITLSHDTYRDQTRDIEVWEAMPTKSEAQRVCRAIKHALVVQQGILNRDTIDDAYAVSRRDIRFIDSYEDLDREIDALTGEGRY